MWFPPGGGQACPSNSGWLAPSNCHLASFPRAFIALSPRMALAWVLPSLVHLTSHRRGPPLPAPWPPVRAGAQLPPADLNTQRRRPPCGRSSHLLAGPGSPTGSSRPRSSSPGPGGWVLGQGQSASLAGPEPPSRSSVAGTPRGNPPGPTCRRTPSPTGRTLTPPRGQRTDCYHPPTAGRGSLQKEGRERVCGWSRKRGLGGWWRLWIQ